MESDRLSLHSLKSSLPQQLLYTSSSESTSESESLRRSEFNPKPRGKGGKRTFSDCETDDSSDAISVSSESTTSDYDYIHADYAYVPTTDVDPEIDNILLDDENLYVINSDSEEESDPDKLFSKSDMTTDEAVLELFELFLNNNWTKTSLENTRKFAKRILPDENNFPSSYSKLMKYVADVGGPVHEVEYYFCRSCKKLKDSKDSVCSECHAKATIVYYHFPIAEQIRFLFEKRNLRKHIDNYKKTVNNDGKIRDIRDGTGYKKIRVTLDGEYDLLLDWNTDGVATAESSNVSLNPIQFTFCDIEPKLRPHFVITCGIWCDIVKPLMSEFLKPFINDLIALHSTGVTWVCPETNVSYTSKIVAPLSVNDSPVRADIQNIHHATGTFSCNFCEQKAKPVKIKQKTKAGKVVEKARRYLVYQKNAASLRTAEKMKRQGQKATEKKPIKGVKGESSVKNLPHFDPSKNLPADYLHSLLLGSVRHFLLLWLFITGSWFCGKSLKDIDKKLMQTKLPDFVRRYPRSVLSVKKWKGSEFRSWLLFYSLPVMKNHLPEKYLQHWMLLVWASFLLLQDEISRKDIEIAHSLLKLFAEKIGTLYRKQDYRYNNHVLLHFKLMVEIWGPLWAISAFLFESNNGVLTKLIHGTKNKGKELAINLRIAQGIEVLRERVKEKQKHNSTKDINIEGKLIHAYTFDEAQMLALREIQLENYQIYSKLKIYKVKYSSLLSAKNHDDEVLNKPKSCDSNISFKCTNSDVSYGEIFCLLRSNKEVKCLVKKFDVDDTKYFVIPACGRRREIVLRHLVPIVETNTYVLCDIKDIQCKLIRNQNYLCIRPNKVEINL